MFIGHFGLGFAVKKASRKPSLGTTFFAAQFIDLLWPFFLFFGIEKVSVDPGNTAFTPLNFISYPYSHSLVAVLVWSLLFGGIYYIIKKDRKRAFLLALLVVSHWLLDLVVHRPDLPLSLSEETKLGFGLWNSKVLTIVVEMLIFSGGVMLYSTNTKAKNKTGTYSLWGLVVFFLLIYGMNLFGDPPPNTEAIGYVGLAQWLFILWGYWIDANRSTANDHL
ncbi:MAG: hypothetical protein EOO10_15310 [Chitinophagaceae bacterium]|nr:MAG: hypothetical protein EOO10_15310 [Chitinophagaceae bacterium]